MNCDQSTTDIDEMDSKDCTSDDPATQAYDKYCDHLLNVIKSNVLNTYMLKMSLQQILSPNLKFHKRIVLIIIITLQGKIVT